MDLESIKAKLSDVQDLIDLIEERKGWIVYLNTSTLLLKDEEDIKRYKSDIARFETELTEKLKTLNN